MVCRQFANKPLPEPMFIHFQLAHQLHNSVALEAEDKNKFLKTAV